MSLKIGPTNHPKMELAEWSKPGSISESNLSKQLRKRGITRKKLSLSPSSRSFRRLDRNACWQGDVQHTLSTRSYKSS